MRARTLVLLGVGLLFGAIALTGAGMALAWGRSGGAPWAGTPGPMMGQSGHGSMMGPNGHGSMMGGSSGSTVQGTPAVGVTQVQIANFAFTPANIQVRAGTTVTWTNQDTASHTVTFKNGMKDSGLLRQGQRFSYTFGTPGTYDYCCAVHPSMTATVTVTA